MTQPLLALDIGSTKVACAVGLPHEQGPGFDMLGTSLVPYATVAASWLSDPLMVGRAVEQALDQAAGAGDCHRALVALNHPLLRSEAVDAMVTLADEPVTVRAQDVDRLRKAALTQALGMDREPLHVELLRASGNGFEGVRDPRGLAATRLRGTFHVLSMPIAARRALVQAVESAGVEVDRMVPTLRAVLAASTDETTAQGRVLVVDIGGVSAEAGLFVEGCLERSATLAWGGLTLAISIAETLQVTMEQAIAWSLEGTACRKREVRTAVEGHWQALREAIAVLLDGQPQPDRILVSGRGSLMDGFVEWIERSTGIPAGLTRNPRTSRLGDVAQQVGLTPAIGLLEMGSRAAGASGPKSQRLVDRLIGRTRTILTEYF